MVDAVGKGNYAQVVKERENIKLPDHRLERWIPHLLLHLLGRSA
jgi:hypothetical protein